MAAKGKVVTVRATVERTSPERIQFKPFATDLTFGGKLQIELEVPADEVLEQEKGGVIVVTAAGFASMLKDYALTIEKMNEQANQERFQPNTRKF